MSNGMKLQDFVSTALVEIIEGVRDAQKRLMVREGPDDFGRVSPKPGGSLPAGSRIAAHEFVEMQLVKFDVAVTVSESKADGAEVGGSFLSVVKADVGGKMSRENTSVSRIQFDVPVTYPVV